jgi:hypothetical protein
MSGHDNASAEIYRGLQALADTSFPRKCVSCGRVFENVDEFVSRTEGLSHSSGLNARTDDHQNPVVELYRNCPCGSTLLELFSDRRDNSEEGEERRTRFGNVLKMVGYQFGLKSDEARFELLKILRGQKSALFESLGIRPRT